MQQYEKITGIVLLALILVVLIGALAGIIVDSSAPTDTDSLTWPTGVPINITLSEAHADTLVSVEYNTTDNGTLRALPTTNYTSFITTGFVQINDNSTWNDTIIVTYQYTTASGSLRALLFIIPLIIVAVFIKKHIDKKNG